MVKLKGSYIFKKKQKTYWCKRQRYLSAVGDRHRDAVLIGDVVGAVIRGARARTRGAATCRVFF